MVFNYFFQVGLKHFKVFIEKTNIHLQKRPNVVRITLMLRFWQAIIQQNIQVSSQKLGQLVGIINGEFFASVVLHSLNSLQRRKKTLPKFNVSNNLFYVSLQIWENTISWIYLMSSVVHGFTSERGQLLGGQCDCLKQKENIKLYILMNLIRRLHHRKQTSTHHTWFWHNFDWDQWPWPHARHYQRHRRHQDRSPLCIIGWDSWILIFGSEGHSWEDRKGMGYYSVDRI